MVHHCEHRHSSYNYPTSHFSVGNKNYEKSSGSSGSSQHIDNNNSSSSSNVVNDNDTFARLRPQTANNASGSNPCGPISSGANGNNAETTDVRWSKLLRHDGTPTKV